VKDASCDEYKSHPRNELLEIFAIHSFPLLVELVWRIAFKDKEKVRCVRTATSNGTLSGTFELVVTRKGANALFSGKRRRIGNSLIDLD
jgi:hypothetical protein